MTNNFIIRNLRECPEHIETLADWHHQQWVSLNPGQTLIDRIGLMQEYLNEEFIPSTFVALGDSGRPLGSAAIIHSDMDIRPQYAPWLASLYVAPQFRSIGLGTALVEHVVSECHQRGIQKFYLFTPDQRAFYERRNWAVLEECEYRNHQVTIMCRRT